MQEERVSTKRENSEAKAEKRKKEKPQGFISGEQDTSASISFHFHSSCGPVTYFSLWASWEAIALF